MEQYTDDFRRSYQDQTMTQESKQSPSLIVAWAGVAIAGLAAMGTMTRDYFQDRADNKVVGVVTTDDVTRLSKQNDELTKAISALNLQIAALPTTRTLDAISDRIGKDDSQIADLYNITTGLRHDFDNRLPPPVFRNPRN